jgi:hypothetical protein
MSWCSHITALWPQINCVSVVDQCGLVPHRGYMLITNMYSWLVFQHCLTIKCYKAARHSLSTDWPWYLEYVLQWLSLLNYTKSSRQGRSKCCKNFENCCMLLSWWWPFKIINKTCRTSTFSTLAFELGFDLCQVSADNTFKKCKRAFYT